MATNPSYPQKVFLNGKIVPSDDAKISVFDRGFIFGDGLYEVMARIGGKYFYREAHLNRLRRGLREIAIDFDVAVFEENIPELLRECGLENKDSLLYMQVSRGAAPRQHSFPAHVPPTFMMYAWEKSLPEIEPRHANAVIQKEYRWSRCDIKSTSLLGNVMANQWASSQDAYETVFYRDGMITEASHSNIFFVRDGVVCTHPANNHILWGITRQVVIDLCEALGIPLKEEAIELSEISGMDEAFLTGTSTQIMALKTLGNHEYFSSEPGPITRKLQEGFLDLKIRNSQAG